MFGKVIARGLGDTGDAGRTPLPEVDFVEVGLQDFLFGIAQLHHQCHDHFIKFSDVRLLGVEEDILDMAGEISNVVAGNIRANLGTNFMISIPLVFEGRPDDLKFNLDSHVYVIPISWKNHDAFVVVGLQ